LLSGQEILVKITASPQAPYGTRVEAAHALEGARAESDLGSGELKLLSHGPGAISLEAANQPFFLYARLRAAQAATDVHLRLQLLGNALAETPAGDDARIPAFYGAASLQKNEYALAIIEHLLRKPRLHAAPVPETPAEEEIISTEETETDVRDGAQETGGSTAASGKRSPLEQAQLLSSVGQVMIRLKRFNEALRYLQPAQKLETAPARRKEILTEMSNVRARLRREHLNAARQPILHAELEQDRLVRPRLVAQAPTTVKQNSKAGEKP
jgi:hypothetical protein